MIKFEHTEVVGWSAAVRGMRNPLESWLKSDSYTTHIEDDHNQTADIAFFVGDNDLDLMKRLIKAGSSDRKFLRMLTVYVDITAPRYWWTEWDTYKVGTVRNSCSTMHKILSRKLTLDDFDREGLTPEGDFQLQETIKTINHIIENRLPTSGETLVAVKKLLPESYRQKATIMLNYEVLRTMYRQRRNHRLIEWNTYFTEWVESLPYAKELIIE